MLAREEERTISCLRDDYQRIVGSDLSSHHISSIDVSSGCYLTSSYYKNSSEERVQPKKNTTFKSLHEQRSHLLAAHSLSRHHIGRTRYLLSPQGDSEVTDLTAVCKYLFHLPL